MEKKGINSPATVNEQSEVYHETDAYIDTPFIEERYEIIEGIRYDFQPSPTTNHQILVTGLNVALDATCHSTGIILVAPMDIYFNEDNIYQPDVIYISNENAKIIKPNRIEGAPDLVIEILSPSTSTNDKINKKNNYAQFGVREYWIVDPVHLYVDQFILEGDKYMLHHTYSVRDILTSPRFTCINVDLSKLFSRLLSTS
ncbi:MAG: Uma2 family endonuclease [Paenibacillaceae bacterium]